MPRVNEAVQVGVLVDCRSKWLHPSEVLRNKYVDEPTPDFIHGLLVVRRGFGSVRHKNVEVIFMTHPDFPDVEFYTPPNNVTFVAQAPPTINNNVVGANNAAAVPVVEEQVSDDEDVDDDRDEMNELAAIEPIPDAIAHGLGDQNEAGDVDWVDRIDSDRRADDGGTRHGSRLSHIDIHSCNEFAIFRHFLPMTYITSILIPATNEADPKLNLTLGEFLRFVGLWMVMTRYPGNARRDFWSITQNGIFIVFPNFSPFMSRNRFDAILSALSFDFQRKKPQYRDRFWKIRAMVDAFNKNMDEHFYASWLTCLDESKASQRNLSWIFAQYWPNSL